MSPPDLALPDAVEVWVDGHVARAEDLFELTLVNFGHFTSLQVRGGAVRGLAEHLARVDATHRELFGHGLDLEQVRSRWATSIQHRPEASLRATFYDDPDGLTHDVVALRRPVVAATAPLSLRSVRWARPFAHLKHVGTFGQIALGRQAQRDGYDDALLTDDDGNVLETTIANIGFLSADRMVWPVGPSLRGVGQRLLETALPKAGRVVAHEAVHLDNLGNFDGAFVVNSVGVVPVASIDAHRFAEPFRIVEPVLAAHAALPWDRL